jgi:hypothetical protein
MRTRNTRRAPHGIPRQINISVPDADSFRSGYGQHKRCTVGAEKMPGLTRILVTATDGVPGTSHLPWPTHEQARDVAREDYPTGRLVFEGSEVWQEDGHEHITYLFELLPRQNRR